MKQLWKKFDKLTEICYMSELEDNCPQWDEAYEVFKQLVAQGREKDPQYAAEILKMDDATDFAYGVADWIEDYLDELDAREEHEKLMERCEELLHLFQWQEVYPGDLKFRIASALAAEDKKEEALKFCEKWYAEDQHEMATTALVYAKMTLKDLEGAEDVVRKYISEDTPCTDENDILFMAAADLYLVNGKEKERMAVTEALQKYEQELEGYSEDMESDISFELPFE